ncbi:hypothetical protein ACSSS7_007225 [Eimeria intestinalis]
MADHRSDRSPDTPAAPSRRQRRASPRQPHQSPQLRRLRPSLPLHQLPPFPVEDAAWFRARGGAVGAKCPPPSFKRFTADLADFPSEVVLCSMWPTPFLRIGDTWDINYPEEFRESQPAAFWSTRLSCYEKEKKTTLWPPVRIQDAQREDKALHQRIQRLRRDLLQADCRRATARQEVASATARPPLLRHLQFHRPQQQRFPSPQARKLPVSRHQALERGAQPVSLALPALADIGGVDSPRTPAFSATPTPVPQRYPHAVSLAGAAVAPHQPSQTFADATTRTPLELSTLSATAALQQREPVSAADEPPSRELHLFPPSPRHSPEPPPATAQLQAAVAVPLPPVTTPSPRRSFAADEEDDTPYTSCDTALRQLQQSTQQQRATDGHYVQQRRGKAETAKPGRKRPREEETRVREIHMSRNSKRASKSPLKPGVLLRPGTPQGYDRSRLVWLSRLCALRQDFVGGSSTSGCAVAAHRGAQSGAKSRTPALEMRSHRWNGAGYGSPRNRSPPKCFCVPVAPTALKEKEMGSAREVRVMETEKRRNGTSLKRLRAPVPFEPRQMQAGHTSGRVRRRSACWCGEPVPAGPDQWFGQRTRLSRRGWTGERGPSKSSASLRPALTRAERPATERRQPRPAVTTARAPFCRQRSAKGSSRLLACALSNLIYQARPRSSLSPSRKLAIPALTRAAWAASPSWRRQRGPGRARRPMPARGAPRDSATSTPLNSRGTWCNRAKGRRATGLSAPYTAAPAGAPQEAGRGTGARVRRRCGPSQSGGGTPAARAGFCDNLGIEAGNGLPQHLAHGQGGAARRHEKGSSGAGIQAGCEQLLGEGRCGTKPPSTCSCAGGSCGGCGVGGAGTMRRAWTYTGWMISVLATGHPAVKCRGESVAGVTSTTAADAYVGTLRPRGSQSAAVRQWTTGAVAGALGRRQSRADPGCGVRREHDVLSHGASGGQARVVTDEGKDFIVVALENEGVLGGADAVLMLIQEIDANEGWERGPWHDKERHGTFEGTQAHSKDDATQNTQFVIGDTQDGALLRGSNGHTSARGG